MLTVESFLTDLTRRMKRSRCSYGELGRRMDPPASTSEVSRWMRRVTTPTLDTMNRMDRALATWEKEAARG